MHKLTSAQRLIVAADFKPPVPAAHGWLTSRVLELADSLAGTDMTLKVNSALRAIGPDLIIEIQHRLVWVFADLKLNDIPETLAADGAWLREYRPNMLTVMCSSGRSAMQALKNELPGTKVLGVTVLTSLSEQDARAIYGCTIETAILRLVEEGMRAGIDGFVCAPSDARMVRATCGGDVLIVTPGIRPEFSIVKGDDQERSRVMTPAEAIYEGADYIVVGRPITQATDPREAALRVVGEIEAASARYRT